MMSSAAMVVLADINTYLLFLFLSFSCGGGTDGRGGPATRLGYGSISIFSTLNDSGIPVHPAAAVVITYFSNTIALVTFP
jgi:hypothetical protein